MIKRIFIGILMFLFFINNSFANYTIPYFNNNEVKFNNIVGEKINETYISDMYIEQGYIYKNANGNILRTSINNSFSNWETIATLEDGYMTRYIGIKDNYIYYIWNKDSKFYRTNLAGPFPNQEKISDNLQNSGGSFILYDNYIYSRATIGGDNSIFRINLSTLTIQDVANSNVYTTFSISGNYLHFAKTSDNKFYRTNLAGPFPNQEKISDNYNYGGYWFNVIGGYLYYINYFGDKFIYRLDLNGVLPSNPEKINSIITNEYSIGIKDNYIYYVGREDNNRFLYRTNLAGPFPNQEKIGNILIDSYKIIEGEYIYFYMIGGGYGKININNFQENILTHKKNPSGMSQVYIVGDYLYYIDNPYIIKVNTNNPQGFGMTDNIYKSDEISNTNEKIYIKTNTTLPNGTDYEFWLANQNTQETIINELGDTFLMMGTRFEDWSGMIDMTMLGLNVGDEIVVFKGGNEATTIITQISPWYIRFNNIGLSDDMGYGIKKGSANFQKLNNSVLDGNTEINTQTIFGNVTDKLFYKIVLIGDSSDTTKTPVVNSVNITATPQTVVTPPGNTGNTTLTGGIDLNLGDGTAISIPAEKQTTDFIKSLATLPSINPTSLNTYSNVEKFLKDNNYDYKNQILIGSGVIPSQTMYNVINLGFNDNSLYNTLSGAINSTNYSKLVLTPETYLAGKRIINYLKMDKTDDDGNLIISIYNSDTKEYIFIKPKN